MPCPFSPGCGSFRQDFRNIRIGVSASTHFIGVPWNNFSHFFSKPYKAALSDIRATCSTSLHPLPESTSVTVAIRFICCPVARHLLASLRCSYSRPIAAQGSSFSDLCRKKNRRQEDRPLPPSVVSFNRICSLPVNLYD
jgi:hypothetical protein